VTALGAVYRGARVLVCVGPGGVGKTTLAAALAVDAAAAGRRVALVTIDPARRLASALGLAGRLEDALRPVPSAPGLEAAMLETRASFDALISRIAASEQERRAILENRVYEAFSRTLARPHAYVAMERLHDLVTRGEHDLVVLDTPPTRSALDILDAPGRLARFAGSGVADALVAALGPRPAGVRAALRRRGQAAVAALLAQLFGRELASDLAAFFSVFLHLRAGFAGRAAEVQRMLRAPDTTFVLTAAPDPTHLEDARALADGLLERGVRVGWVLSNRLARTSLSSSRGAEPPPAAGAIGRARAYRDRLLAEDAARVARAEAFVAALPERPRHLGVPELSEAPLDVASLRRLAASVREFASGAVSS
jgi:anion-transporting  ArsA/GET3 family ATPase